MGVGALPLSAALSDDRSALAAAMARWSACCKRSGDCDVMTGAAGALLAAAEIEAHQPGRVPRDLIELQHRRVTGALARARDHEGKHVYLGLAHGIAGLLLGLETARAAFGLPIARGLADWAFDVIAETRLEGPHRTAVWPLVADHEEIPLHGWCHGAPGIALALLVCFELTGKPDYRRLAVQGLEATYRFGTANPSFCCGAAGRAQILIEGFRILGERGWLRKARQVSAALPVDARGKWSRTFHRGRLGLRYLAYRLAHPEVLPMPGLGLPSAPR